MSHPLIVPRTVAGGASALNGIRFAAGIVWPVSSPPIPNGAVLVGPDGRISSVGPATRVPSPAGVAAVNAPHSVLLPGLVNAHTHLELTGFAGTIEDDAFFEWIQHIRRRKAETSAESFVEAAKQGVRDAWAGGITTVADTGDTGAAAKALAELGGRGIVYQEVFGPHPGQLEDSFHGLVQAVEQLGQFSGEKVTIGVSPHAPYSVSGPLFRQVAEYARGERLPIALHLAESRDESAFLRDGSGPFADLWRRRGIPLPGPSMSPVGYLNQFGVLGPDTLVIHAVQTTELDRRTLRHQGCAVALCPRSNLRHGHGEPPISAYLADGIRAGLGSDSVASVNSLDLFAEARAARTISGCSAAEVVRLLTLGGAEALGRDGEIGSLEAGKWADLCLVEIGEGGWATEAAAERILEAGPESIGGTWVAGRSVFNRTQA